MKFTTKVSLEKILEITGATPKGNLDAEILGLNEVHMVEKGDISFVDHPKYYNKILASKADIILINTEDVEVPEGKLLLISEDPFAAFVKLIKYFKPFESSNKNISDSAKIGKNTVIQPNCFVGNNVIIGDNCIIHSNVSIYDDVVIGNNVIIQSGSIIGGDAFYFQKRDGKYRKFETCGNVIIEDDVEIGALCTIDKGVTGDTRIGQGCKFDNHVQVGHDTVIGKNCLIGCHCSIAGVAIIEDDVVVWSKSAINKDLVIGKGAVVLAVSAVDKSVPAGQVVFGVPAIEANKKWRELAALRNLPDILKKLDV
ncbi:UDP-3-O-(3-hydroxymyristoyl)glucosamine N-acyltransferase [Bacteroidales bacterium OttesenSCG-928-K22]|nr:UDP-3-O-(3-hydroxymyristoyl)glucosamine N-acyltransferase [Bacteroidales bacterium OttesenSCG-928-L14]MDL2240214.1 UDP-3-O-(3-hydroxymyristoyl)glucosamine N-acyltransferase [Bacteroidales bacterium OttesenSCG-928-K22]